MNEDQKTEIMDTVLRALSSALDDIRENHTPDYKNWVREVPEMRAMYYCALAFPEGYDLYWSDWVGDLECQTRLYFTTREDCELAVEMLNRQRELIGDWKPDWGDSVQEKVVLVWDFIQERPLATISRVSKMQAAAYMPSQAAETLIEEYGDKLAVILK